MKTFRDYIIETEAWIDKPAAGDDFAINVREECLIETYIVDTVEDGVVLQADEHMMALLEQYGLIGEKIGRYGAVGSNAAQGYSIGEQDMGPGDHLDAIENDKIGDELDENSDYIDPNQHPQTKDYGRGQQDDQEDDLPFEPGDKISDRDQFGNPIKHMARHLARKGMRQAMAQKRDKPVEEDYMPRMLELAGISLPVAETAPIQPNPNAARTDPLAAKAADLAPVGTERDPGTATTIDEAVMKDIAIELAEIADAGDYDRLYDLLTSTSPAGEMVQDMYADVARDFRLEPDDDQDIILDRLMDRIVKDFGGQLDEAKYRGREVKLGKPMAGDVKKSKVYVRGPKGNVVKVNFGDPNMRIKKSNPARRKSFRARHNCDNPGPRWKARYWSCRAW